MLVFWGVYIHIAHHLFVAKLQAFAGTRTPGVMCQFHAEVRKPIEKYGDLSDVG